MCIRDDVFTGAGFPRSLGHVLSLTGALMLGACAQTGDGLQAQLLSQNGDTPPPAAAGAFPPRFEPPSRDPSVTG